MDWWQVQAETIFGDNKSDLAEIEKYCHQLIKTALTKRIPAERHCKEFQIY